MKMILEGRTGTGFTVAGESVMLSRYGDVYPTIDNKMHPNPGTEADGYSEIERSIDWLYLHDFKAIRLLLDKWVQIRAVWELETDSNQSIEEIIHNIFYDDLYTLSKNAKDAAIKIIKDLQDNPREITEDELEISRKIASFINEKFLRVRAGGKLNPEGADAIYFRISSHGFDWHRVIVDFLWDVFKEPSKMPKEINVLHDAETNPPEIFLFRGTAEELFTKYDTAIFESIHSCKNKYNDIMNHDRLSFKLNKMFRDSFVDKSQYKPFV